MQSVHLTTTFELFLAWPTMDPYHSKLLSPVSFVPHSILWFGMGGFDDKPDNCF